MYIQGLAENWLT